MTASAPGLSVRVDGVRVVLAPGMTVRHALVAAGRLAEVLSGKVKAHDRWGNELGLDGAVAPGDAISLR